MVPLRSIYTAQRRRRLKYRPFHCSEWNTSHPRQIFQNMFTKGITIKKTIVSNWTQFSYADWPILSLCKTKMLKCFALVWHYFDNTHVKTYAIISFFLSKSAERVLTLLFFVNSEHIQLYLYLVWVINWQPVWLEYTWHAVNLNKQT